MGISVDVVVLVGATVFEGCGVVSVGTAHPTSSKKVMKTTNNLFRIDRKVMVCAFMFSKILPFFVNS